LRQLAPNVNKLTYKADTVITGQDRTVQATKLSSKAMNDIYQTISDH